MILDRKFNKYKNKYISLNTEMSTWIVFSVFEGFLTPAKELDTTKQEVTMSKQSKSDLYQGLFPIYHLSKGFGLLPVRFTLQTNGRYISKIHVIDIIYGWENTHSFCISYNAWQFQQYLSPFVVHLRWNIRPLERPQRWMDSQHKTKTPDCIECHHRRCCFCGYLSCCRSTRGTFSLEVCSGDYGTSCSGKLSNFRTEPWHEN